ncbi:Protein TolB [Fundidesulfovibrio magnetotacticus]|uniref:Protein TolB n=1 Tax=Fundidesulfovibrio magnetotacticus TaxID=2730080 RepID=A0A6V8LS40_9BACT|nr:PD40 domain-containing protein [Fundidesulfovibrio magnetotacticus]GFK92427.1 Protein TolB [Fundidesulfovibrio magnetotacticus]
MVRNRAFLACALATLLSLAMAADALAQDTLAIEIQGPGQARMNIVQSKPFGDGNLPSDAQYLNELIRKNLAFMPFLKIMSDSDILGGATLSGPKADQIDFKPFTLAKVDLVVTSVWKPGKGLGDVELRAYEVFSQKMLLGKAYAGVTRDQLPEVADRFCMELMALLTGQGSIFKSKLAFVKPSGKGKDIWMVGAMGRELAQVTRYGDLGMAISPAWSWDGGRICFTLIGSTSHYLGIWSGGKANVFTLPSSTVISPHFMPNGTVAVALNIRHNTDIYTLDSSYKQTASTLVADSSIDVSPSFDQSGNLMAFVSDRLGNPNVFVKDLASGSVRRASKAGYNTNPAMSPDGKYVAYSKQAGGGHRIFVYELATDTEKQCSFGPGSDENPTFAPDSFFIAFSSSRAGGKKLYLTTRNGDGAVQIPTGEGDAIMPAFSPVAPKE